MSSTSIQWHPEKILRTNIEHSKKVYNFLEKDFATCLEYVDLNENHLCVHSSRLADLIVRIGPEILRLFDLFLLNPRRSGEFVIEPKLETKILDIQRKKDSRRDDFMDYLNAFNLAWVLGGLSNIGVEVKAIGKYLVPFKTEKRKRNEKEVDVVFWWEDGYNALKHRIVYEFEKSATLKHALFSLAGLWILHDCLARDWGGYGTSSIFGRIIDKITGKSDIEILH